MSGKSEDKLSNVFAGRCLWNFVITYDVLFHKKEM